jgi:hypothetical protein
MRFKQRLSLVVLFITVLWYRKRIIIKFYPFKNYLFRRFFPSMLPKRSESCPAFKSMNR